MKQATKPYGEKRSKIRRQHKQDKPGSEVNERRQDFILRLIHMKAEAGTLELWETMHALDAATEKVGWEIAKKLTAEKRKKAGKV